MNSFDFELPGEPDQLKPLRRRARNTGSYERTTISIRNAPVHRVTTSLRSQHFRMLRSIVLGRFGHQAHHLLRARTSATTDFAVLKSIPISENKHIRVSRGDFQHLQPHAVLNPDGNSTDGSQFGQVTAGKDPRLMQFALKFYF